MRRTFGQHELFAGKLAPGIGAGGRRSVGLDVGSVSRVARVNVIGADVHQHCLVTHTPAGEVLRTDRVDRVGEIGFILRAIDKVVGRGIDHAVSRGRRERVVDAGWIAYFDLRMRQRHD